MDLYDVNGMRRYWPEQWAPKQPHNHILIEYVPEMRESAPDHQHHQHQHGTPVKVTTCWKIQQLNI